jgi:hypothetical protein
MAEPQRKPASKLHATRTPGLAGSRGDEHEEAMIDESVDESFPASDPPAIANPGSSLAVKSIAESGRETFDGEGEVHRVEPGKGQAGAGAKQKKPKPSGR